MIALRLIMQYLSNSLDSENHIFLIPWNQKVFLLVVPVTSTILIRKCGVGLETED